MYSSIQSAYTRRQFPILTHNNRAEGVLEYMVTKSSSFEMSTKSLLEAYCQDVRIRGVSEPDIRHVQRFKSEILREETS